MLLIISVGNKVMRFLLLRYGIYRGFICRVVIDDYIKFKRVDRSNKMFVS